MKEGSTRIEAELVVGEQLDTEKCAQLKSVLMEYTEVVKCTPGWTT